MESKIFIKNKLESLASIYHNILIEYYFDKFDNDHYVIIRPEEVRESIVERFAVDIDMEFIRNYPNECLTFFYPDEDEYDLGELIFNYAPLSEKKYTKYRNVKSFFTHSNYFISQTQCISLPKEKKSIVDEIIEDFSKVAGNEEFALAA